MDASAEELAIVRRIFVAACHKFGSAASFASFLGISHSELSSLLEGRGMPSDAVLLQAVDQILEDLPSMREEFSAAAWNRVLPAR
jgi:Na+-translocating ferredoxin:NAD+ oxidoreductase RnfE subunit